MQTFTMILIKKTTVITCIYIVHLQMQSLHSLQTLQIVKHYSYSLPLCTVVFYVSFTERSLSKQECINNVSTLNIKKSTIPTRKNDRSQNRTFHPNKTTLATMNTSDVSPSFVLWVRACSSGTC